MKYEPLATLTHEHAAALAQGDDVVALSRAALSIALGDDDLEWSTAYLLSLVTHTSANVRGNALLGFGHLARRFRALPHRASVDGGHHGRARRRGCVRSRSGRRCGGRRPAFVRAVRCLKTVGNSPTPGGPRPQSQNLTISTWREAKE